MARKIFILTSVAVLTFFVACRQKSVSLEGSWLIETVYDNPVVATDSAVITFDVNALQVRGYSGCNRFFGPYSTDNSHTLSLKNLATTLMVCPDSLSEAHIMKAFGETATYSVEKYADRTALFFYNVENKKIMELTLL